MRTREYLLEGGERLLAEGRARVFARHIFRRVLVRLHVSVHVRLLRRRRHRPNRIVGHRRFYSWNASQVKRLSVSGVSPKFKPYI